MQLDKARFAPPLYLHPTKKDLFAFATWCIDLITNLVPRGPNGKRYLIVAVCAYTKWFEADALTGRSAKEIADWVNAHIVCHFGVLLVIHTDRGTEFAGWFKEYLM